MRRQHGESGMRRDADLVDSTGRAGVKGDAGLTYKGDRSV
jgi:hypothetical protein